MLHKWENGTVGEGGKGTRLASCNSSKLIALSYARSESRCTASASFVATCAAAHLRRSMSTTGVLGLIGSPKKALASRSSKSPLCMQRSLRKLRSLLSSPIPIVSDFVDDGTLVASHASTLLCFSCLGSSIKFSHVRIAGVDLLAIFETILG